MDKCKFYVTKMKYLGLIVSTERIKIDPAKVTTIRNWDRPTYVKEIRLFIGFCNFYRRFIYGFSNMASPLNAMTKKETMKKHFAWTDECEKVFQELKNCVCKVPILCHFDPSKQCFVETNSSDYINAGMLSQLDDEGVLHLVAYFFRKMAPAECNYEIYDKELLVIIRCFEEWRSELEGTGLPVKVFTDHKDLEYFMSTKKLTPRQVRWAEFLSEFNFVISYQSGKKNDKADALTRKPNKQLTDDENKRRKHSVRVLLPSNRINHEAELQPIDKDHGEVPGEVWANSEAVSDTNEETSTLPERIMESNQNNELCNEICSYFANQKRLEKLEAYLKGLRVETGLLIKGNRLWVTKKGHLQLEVIKEIHDQPAVGHPSMERTLGMAQRHYYWLSMKEMIQRFIRNCHMCKQAKAARDTYHGLLQSLPVPEQAWTDITMDFVVELPKYKAYRQIYDAILMVIYDCPKRGTTYFVWKKMNIRPPKQQRTCFFETFGPSTACRPA